MSALLLPYPRRTRRRLLLPPGLLALAWLLWLGCVAVPQLPEIHKRQFVMQISMPPLSGSGLSHWSYPVDASPQEINRFRPWHDFNLTGNVWPDYFALRDVYQAYRQLHDSPDDKNGIRITLGPESTYGQLVLLIDWANQLNIKRYWLDIKRQPTVFYLCTAKQRAAEVPLCWNDVVNIDARPQALHSLKTRIFNWLSLIFTPATYAPFLAPDWRNSLLLLLLIGGLSAVRLGRR